MAYPPERIEKKAKKIERDLLALIALYLLGQLSKAQTRIEGLQLIDEAFRAMVAEVNQFYRDLGFPSSLTPESAQLRKRWAEIVSEFDTLLNTDDEYWKSEEGVKRGMGFLAVLVAYAVASAITVSIAQETLNAVLVWVTKEDPDVCLICEGFKGEYDPHDPNLPTIPPHPNGRCWWEIVIRGR